MRNNILELVKRAQNSDEDFKALENIYKLYEQYSWRVWC